MGHERVSEWRVSLEEQRKIGSSIVAERSQAKGTREGGWVNHCGGVKRNKIKSDSNNLIHTGNHQTKQTTVLVTVDAKRIQLWAQNDDSYTFFQIFA